jgi:prephenate dehydratase
MARDRVAFQGVHGAYSEQAVRQHFGDAVDTHPCRSFSALFEALQSGDVTYGLLPVENALAGAVSQAYELLLDYDFRIQAEVILHVRHCLLATQGVTVEDVTKVYSHPQALAQCERYLKRYNYEPMPRYDTAGAARNLAENPEPDAAAIASELAASLYNLNILEPYIEDVSFNYTRFLLLGNDDPPKADYNKTSLVFATRNRPAALYECLGEFAQRGLNLTKIESRPRRNRPWEPVFYVDFEGHWSEPVCQELLARLLQRASFVKMFGSYPAVVTKSVGI